MKSFLKILCVGVPVGLAFEILPLGWALGTLFLLLLYFAWDLSKVFFCLFLLAWTCEGATYYVDFSGGSDAANGTSTATPWKHMPGDPNATGNAAGTTVTSGSTIYLKGGVRYNLTGGRIIIDSAHYAVAGPLTIDSGSSVSFGSGMPILDGAAVATGIFVLDVCTNLTIRGLNLGDTVFNSGADPAIRIQGCMSNVIDSCAIHDIGTNNASAHQTGVEIALKVAGVYSAYIIVTNCTIWNVTQKGIETSAVGACRFTHNIIWNCSDHGITLTSPNNSIDANIISNTSPAGGVWLRPYNASGGGYGIKFSVGTVLGTDAFTTNNIAYNNIVVGGPSPDQSGPGIVIIDNNQNSSNFKGDSNKIFNNTFINIDPTQNSYGSGVKVSTGQGPINGTMVCNNIFYSTASGGSAGGISTPAMVYIPIGPNLGNNNLIAYNCTYDPNSVTHPALQVSGIDHNPSWANFCDTGITSPDYRFKVAANGTGNSCPAGNQFFDTDPKFVSYPADLRLQQSSPVKAAGTNLSVYFTVDFNGFPRSSWSMGAFELAPFPPVVTNVHLIFTGKGTASGKVIMQ